MCLIFCSDPLNARQPDPAYLSEIIAAQQAGVSYSLISFELLVEEQDVMQAVYRIEPATLQETGIYRGWMLKPQTYELLYKVLAERNIILINTPAAYKHCHYLPESYAVIKDLTPFSVWLKQIDLSMDAVMATLQPFGDRPVILKDFVKSRKHEWDEACYIPSASNLQAVEHVVTRFLQLQGEDLNEGLVFREFVEFEPLTKHSKSAMPLTKEFRLFFLDGQLILSTPYWEEGDYHGVIPPLDMFCTVAKNVQSRFFTMDVAKKLDGTWMIVELGDGQVAGLPYNADVNSFYSGLIQSLIQA